MSGAVLRPGPLKPLTLGRPLMCGVWGGHGRWAMFAPVRCQGPTGVLVGEYGAAPARARRVTGWQSAPRGGRPPVLDPALRSTRGACQAPIQTRRLVCSTRAPRLTWGFVAHPAGFEPATIGLEVRWFRVAACYRVPFCPHPPDHRRRFVSKDAVRCRASPELRSIIGAHTACRRRPMALREVLGATARLLQGARLERLVRVCPRRGTQPSGRPFPAGLALAVEPLPRPVARATVRARTTSNSSFPRLTYCES